MTNKEQVQATLRLKQDLFASLDMWVKGIDKSNKKRIWNIIQARVQSAYAKGYGAGKEFIIKKYITK